MGWGEWGEWGECGTIGICVHLSSDWWGKKSRSTNKKWKGEKVKKGRSEKKKRMRFGQRLQQRSERGMRYVRYDAVKEAIYAWRGGERGAVDEVEEGGDPDSLLEAEIREVDSFFLRSPESRTFSFASLNWVAVQKAIKKAAKVAGEKEWNEGREGEAERQREAENEDGPKCHKSRKMQKMQKSRRALQRSEFGKKLAAGEVWLGEGEGGCPVCLEETKVMQRGCGHSVCVECSQKMEERGEGGRSRTTERSRK